MSGRVLSTGIHDLKSIDFALVNLIAVEAPSAGMSLAGELLEFLDAALGIVPTSDCLQVVADELVQALAERFGLFTSAGDELVDRKAHSHSISGHGLCKALPAVPSGLMPDGAGFKTPDGTAGGRMRPPLHKTHIDILFARAKSRFLRARCARVSE